MIAIIGAGPVGSHAAWLLARKDKEVNVLEEHSDIGRPVQCTGIVTQSVTEIIRPRKEFLVNRLEKARLHAPDGRETEVKVSDLVIDRTRFDSHLAERASEAGARISLNSRVTGIAAKESRKKLKITNTKTMQSDTMTADTLIGADGPNSIVSRFLGNRKPVCWIGIQALADMPAEKKTYEVYFGDKIPGFFGWVVPENENRARVGIATTRNPRQVFDRFMKRFEKCRIIEMQGGLIPKYDTKLVLQRDGSYVVGDAATQVKATTGGGLVPGLKAAGFLAKSIIDCTEYKKELKPVNQELKTSLLLRNILDRFCDDDYNKLIDIIGNESIKRTLNQHDRDSPSKIVFKSIIREPKLLLFSRTLLRAKRL
jgi:digeranylgeranylglycerophospholipid reductase